MAIHSTVSFDELNLDEALSEHRLDFDSWTKLITNVEKKFPDDIEKLSLVYDSFLSEFPLCCGYWRKYVTHKARLSCVEEVVKVYEKSVESASFSVDIWVDYCSFAISVFEDPFDVSRLFRRGLSFIGKDYLCHALWDKYIEFEFSQKQWSSLSQIYIEALKFPTKKLHQYYDSFKKLVTIWEEEPGCHGDSVVKLQPETGLDEELIAPENDEVSFVINDLLEPSTRSEAIKKYLSIGEHLYQSASQLDLKIDCFEQNILRTYFHVKPLDDDQLENWHHYLDFVEMNGDFDWAVKLYERCLIPCASYSEFWMRYVEYVESKGGREIANDALERATRIFLKDLPAIHLFNAGIKEQIGDVCDARTAFLHFDRHSESSFVDYVMRRANMEKRSGNSAAAYNVYKEALAVATKKMSNTLPILYIHFSRLQYMVTNSVDSARDILIDGVRNVANCKLLLEELINLAVNHEAARQINILDPIVADVIVPGSDVSRVLSYKDRLDISELYLKFIDLCGSIHDFRRAWNRHVKMFPHSFRAYSTCMQPVRTSQRKILSDGTHGTAYLKEVTRIEVNPLIKLSADNAENQKDVPDEDKACKADEESRKLACEAADNDRMENDKNDKICDIQKEQLHVSGRDEPPSLHILSLNERVNGPHNLSSVMLECEQNVEPDPGSSLLNNAQVNSFGQGYCEIWSPQCSREPNDPESHCGPPKRQNSPPRHCSRLSWVEGQDEEQSQSQSPRQRVSPDESGGQPYSNRPRQNRPMYYDNSRGQRGRRMQNERRGPAGYGRRGRNQRFGSTSQMPPGYVGQYPMQSSEQQVNMQSNQMWQYYYYQQQQLMLLQQQQLQAPQQQLQVQPELQSQELLQSQANQMQLLQYQYQQMQLQYQLQQQQQQQVPKEAQQQPQADQHIESQAQQPQLHVDLQTQQQQHLYQQMQTYHYHQQYLLYFQQHQQQLLSPEKHEQNEPHEQQDGVQQNEGASSQINS